MIKNVLRKSSGYIFLLVACLLFAGNGHVYALSAIDMGSLRNNKPSSAKTINNLGEIIGRSDLKDGESHAFLWQDGKLRDLKTLGGSSSTANAINDQSQVVGVSYTRQAEANGQYPSPFLWENGKMHDLSSFFPPNSYATPTAINNDGDIVGSYRADAQGRTHAFLLRQGVMTDLGTMGGDYSTAMGINAQGQIVGTYGSIALGRAHGFLWDDGASIDLTDPNSPDNFQVAGINNAGQVAGSRKINGQGDWRAFRWENGVFTELGDLNQVGGSVHYSQAAAINDSGDVVGESLYVDQDGVASLRAFLWSAGAMANLGTLVLEPTSYSAATGINNAGQIVGYNFGYFNNDPAEFFLKALLWQ